MVYKQTEIGVSVSLPGSTVDAFRALAVVRTAARDPAMRRRRVWAQDLYEEAIRVLETQLAGGEPVAWLAAVRTAEKKTIRIDPPHWTIAQAIATRYDVSIPTVVRTALLRFLEGQG